MNQALTELMVDIAENDSPAQVPELVEPMQKALKVLLSEEEMKEVAGGPIIYNADIVTQPLSDAEMASIAGGPTIYNDNIEVRPITDAECAMVAGGPVISNMNFHFDPCPIIFND